MALLKAVGLLLKELSGAILGAAAATTQSPEGRRQNDFGFRISEFQLRITNYGVINLEIRI